MKERPANSRVQHGDPSCADYGCKRQECLEARRRKQKRNKLLRTTGRPGMVSAQRAAAHLAKFRQAGLQDPEIVSMLPVGRNTFYRVMRGEPLTRTSEQKILSVPAPASLREIRTLAAVDATGTHRRLRALMWIGWPAGVLEQRIGVHKSWISRSFRAQTRVTQAVEARIRALYDECWNLQPEHAGVDAGEAEDTRVYARSQGWHGPLSWDDDTIDEPTVAPVTDALAPVTTEGGNIPARWLMGESVDLVRIEDRREVLQHLYEWTNDTTTEIAARLGVTPAAAERQWERIKERAATDGRRLWRRAYIPRERTLKQDEMEEAA
ncbi:hypothetical protein ACGFZS_47080 [Streptomyces sp. NPDC048288]|uniref:hypothetical protein n=1 Tax=Streptomyces sp. NPDC048288 TaxID=3365529 RepID=UPI00371C01FC